MRSYKYFTYISCQFCILGNMYIFQLKSNDMFYKIEPAWILLLEHITVCYHLMLKQHSR